MDMIPKVTYSNFGEMGILTVSVSEATNRRNKQYKHFKTSQRKIIERIKSQIPLKFVFATKQSTQY